MGVEPTTSRATTWHSNQLSYTHHNLARLKGFEPPALCLEGRCSIQLSYRRKFKVERVMGIEPTQPAWKAGALPLSYTRISPKFQAKVIIPHLHHRVKPKLYKKAPNPDFFWEFGADAL